MRRMRIVDGKTIFERDGKIVSEEEFDEGWVTPAPNYKKQECASVQPDHGDFSMENKGKGRYNPQLAERPNDPNAYFTSVGNVREAAKRRGFSTEE